MKQVNWGDCKGDVWCSFANLNLGDQFFDDKVGVYIIWHGGPNSKVVKVGQGNIRERVKDHRKDPDILAYENLSLYVTWTCDITGQELDGVENYLGNKLNPLVAERFPEAIPISVNLPW